MIYGNYFYRPNETYHLATRKFLQKELFKSDFCASIPPSDVIGKCYVMHVRDYFKYKPEVGMKQFLTLSEIYIYMYTLLMIES